ncbi:MAG: DinB family protein [Chloroflexi bacterium]|nr:DinB family protein [Chloroflexota bacterium]
MEQLYEYRERLLNRLEAIATEIAGAVTEIPQSRWREPVKPDGRSPRAILSSLCDVERYAYSLRLQRILAEDTPTLDSFTPQPQNPALTMTDLLAEYKTLRQAELEILRRLPPAGWGRVGRHPTFGLRTVQWWAERTLEHSKRHLQELRGE